MQNKIVAFLISLVISFHSLAQARLTIVNNSMREMSVKVMQGTGRGTLHETVFISAYDQETVYFSRSGSYFTKSKATIARRDPVYKKGKSFRVTNDNSGYSVLTLTFTIKESAVIESTGQTISKTEFDQD